MNPDQTAPIGAVWSGSILFAIHVYASKMYKQIYVSEQTTIFVNRRKKVKAQGQVQCLDM